MSLLAIQSDALGYGDQRVLGPVSLDIRAGEHLILLGKSGCGKSTLLNHIYSENRRECALIPQGLGLVECLSVFHNVYMGRLPRYTVLHNIRNLIRPAQARVAEILPLLERLGLAAKCFSQVADLSGGQQQRVAVARALFQDAPVLLADEPVSALDGPEADRVMSLLGQNFATAVITLHDVDRALRYGQRIIAIQNGELVLDQPSGRLTASALNEFY
ncbi:ATP-binding cassette domain-containing protein [Amphritea pacifica]|uniref:ATP-binding cassette domain-containing protein n=1 Tax=Amphritea pacifica TaxID=2811233 RepID=A0ABS2W514_9GAMM|nr:ATP-binding cassette domain-containing protein [Amphritea pacifica]MBN0986592.1 ATP-binding cassette domain-containing protein [Amphritea pacifica]MBN1008448.1 ATP-binding cassette domain-containing protein [Amphritea pacifica]